MKILVLGGSGILSTDFTKKTLDMGDEVWIVNRGKRKEFIDQRAHLIIANLRNETIKSLKSKLKDMLFDVVIDFLSFNPEQMKKTLAILDGRYLQYIFISSATVYLKSDENEIITENTKIGNKNWEYAYNKALCERFLCKTNINYTIIRPYVTYGISRIPFPIIPDGYHYTLLKRMKEGKPIILYNEGKAVCTLTHTRDFAEILYKLMLNPQSYREDFHITSEFVQTWKDVYLIMCDIMKIKPNYVSVSEEKIKKFLPESYEVLIGDKGTNMIFDNSKVLEAIGGYEFKVNLFVGLQESINYFEKNERMQGIDFRWDGKIDYMISKICKKYKKYNLTCLENNNTYGNNPMYYYILRYDPFRLAYELARKIKHKLKRGNK